MKTENGFARIAVPWTSGRDSNEGAKSESGVNNPDSPWRRLPARDGRPFSAITKREGNHAKNIECA